MVKMTKEVATASVSTTGTTTLKRKKQEASASAEGPDEIPNPNGTAGTKKKTDDAILSEASEILKLKKEAFGETRLWRQIRVPGALERWIKKAREEEEEARQPPTKKRKKTMVRKTRLPNTLIDVMKQQPYHCIEDMSDEELANQTESFRELYALFKFVDAKMNAYEQALIKQFDSQGYAEDETEVTDDDDGDGQQVDIIS